MLASIIDIAGTFFLYSTITDIQLLTIFGYLPLYILLNMIMLILYALLLEDVRMTTDRRPFRIKVDTFVNPVQVFVRLFQTIAGLAKPLLTRYTNVCTLGGLYGIYIVLAIAYRLLGHNGFCANMLDMVRPVNWLCDQAKRVLTALNRP